MPEERVTDRPADGAGPLAGRPPEKAAVPPKLKGVRRLYAALLNSLAGGRDIWRTEEAFRIEVALLVLSVPAATWITTDLFERAILIGAVLGIMLAEVINSAIEATVDRIGPERHEKSRIAKDLGSLAVLIAAAIAAILWGAAAFERFAA
jgi:diacylglycerol kinase (ATP)